MHIKHVYNLHTIRMMSGGYAFFNVLVMLCLFACSGPDSVPGTAKEVMSNNTAELKVVRPTQPDVATANADSVVSASLTTIVIDSIDFDQVQPSNLDSDVEAMDDYLTETNDEFEVDGYFLTSGQEGQGRLRYSSGELRLESERLIETLIIKIMKPDFIDERDSILAIIEERMSLGNERNNTSVVLEKWISPVNYKGYKFNRKKLIVYGVAKIQAVAIFYYLDNYYFTVDRTLYNLDETAVNTGFEMVRDTALSRHLLDYEDKL